MGAWPPLVPIAAFSLQTSMFELCSPAWCPICERGLQPLLCKCSHCSEELEPRAWSIAKILRTAIARLPETDTHPGESIFTTCSLLNVEVQT